jgi:hypothetical protein
LQRELRGKITKIAKIEHQQKEKRKDMKTNELCGSSELKL